MGNRLCLVCFAFIMMNFWFATPYRLVLPCFMNVSKHTRCAKISIYTYTRAYPADIIVVLCKILEKCARNADKGCLTKITCGF